MPRRSPTHHVDGISHLVGAWLKGKRQEAGLTLEEVSDRTQIPPSTVSRLERGKYQMTVLQFVLLATAIRCPITELLAACMEGGGASGSA
jgi:transcriptional regulator with XRE-family HTH domain